MHELDLWVNLKSAEGIEEIIPYLFEFIMRAQRGEGLFTPEGRSTTHFGEAVTIEGVRKVLTESIIDPVDMKLPDKLAQFVAQIILSGEVEVDTEFQNPTIRGLETIAKPKAVFLQAIHAELIAYQEREILRYRLERASTQTKHVRVIGGLAAGKTTFLQNVAKILKLEEANIEVQGSEPEDSEVFYPELEHINNLQFQRSSTRGEEATLGSERLQLFAQLGQTKELIDVRIHSGGGHAQAELPIEPSTGQDFDAVAFFIDYELMAEIATVDFSKMDDDDVLINKESVIQTVRSLLTRIQELRETHSPRIGVLTKVPKGMSIAKQVFATIHEAYEKILSYAKENEAAVTNIHETGGTEIIIPSYIDVEQEFGKWFPIHDDNPTYTGTLGVVQALISETATYGKGTPDFRLVTLGGETGNPSLVHYSQVI